jgi:hypothetical protein
MRLWTRPTKRSASDWKSRALRSRRDARHAPDAPRAGGSDARLWHRAARHDARLERDAPLGAGCGAARSRHGARTGRAAAAGRVGDRTRRRARLAPPPRHRRGSAAHAPPGGGGRAAPRSRLRRGGLRCASPVWRSYVPTPRSAQRCGAWLVPNHESGPCCCEPRSACGSQPPCERRPGAVCVSAWPWSASQLLCFRTLPSPPRRSLSET